MASHTSIHFAIPGAARRCGWLALLIGVLAASARATIIDFETTPGGTPPTDDLTLPYTSPYVFPGLSVSFGIDANSDGTVDTNAVFEHAGLDPFEPPNGGFAGSAGTDTADPGFTAQLGNFFLRGPTGGADFGLFAIDYSGSTVVTAASGEIWDIDGTASPADLPASPRNTRYAPTTPRTICWPRRFRRSAYSLPRLRRSTANPGLFPSAASPPASPKSRSTSPARSPAASDWRSTISIPRAQPCRSRPAVVCWPVSPSAC